MIKKALFSLAALFLAAATFIACDGNFTQEVLTGGTEVPYEKMGVVMFTGNRTVGSLQTQMSDVKALKINYARTTFWFDTGYMPYRGASPNFTRFDDALSAAESAGVELLPILGYVPSWLQGSGDWKSVYINDYVIPVVSRYKGRVKYWEIWNEPDEMTYNSLNGSADDYFDLLKMASSAIHSIDPSAYIVSAASANITADGISKWEWTQRLIDLGLANYADVLNVHYYADMEFELSSIGGPMVTNSGLRVWVTETGKSGQSSQKDYFEANMAYIEKSIAPERIYWYCYVQGEGAGEESPPDSSYGLVTTYGGFRYESSLYTHLKTR
ncbi:MAG: hypothetical protein HY751_08845 [Nitrospinae bacterium]|nr:hypothetical protein [Nitrospinota bacterium]